MAKAQDWVARALDERDYLVGWTDAALLAKEVTKMAEGLSEFAQYMYLPPALSYQLARIGWEAAFLLEHPRYPTATYNPEDLGHLQNKLADMQVVLFCMADLLGILAGEEFDVVRTAVQKATADVERGIR